MRKARPIATALLLALAPIPLSAPARAQSSAEDPTTAMARARFKEGVEYYDKGEFDQARASFLQAYALKKHPAVLLNLAWSCLKSGHPLEADHYFRQFLSDGRDISEKQRADANDGLAQAHGKLGRIEIVAAAGTEVTVDGERAGNAPLADAIWVEAGAHTVKFRGTDGASDTQSITVMSGEKALARFKASSAPAAPPPAPAPPAAAPAEEPPAPPPASKPTPAQPRASEESTPPAARAKVAEPVHAEAEKKSIFSAPKSVAPLLILGLGAAAGYGVAVAMLVFKQSAQDKADSVYSLLVQAQTTGSGPCAGGMQFDSCNSAYKTDVNNVNDDATVGNVALGVGVAATVGAVIYWLASDKEDDRGSANIVAPVVGHNQGGVTVTGRF